MPATRNKIPLRPTADGPLGDGPALKFFQALWDECFGPESQPLDTTTAKIRRTPRGWYVDAQAQRGGGTGGGLQDRGEWSETESYSIDDIVSRVNLGRFVCYQAPPVGTPPEGGAPYWNSWGMPSPGVWA